MVIEKIKLGEPHGRIVDKTQFPLYFYLQLDKNKNINIIVNIILKADIDSELKDNIEINGYLLNENDILRRINGEYIQLKDPIEGYYSNGFDMGYMQITREYIDGYDYLLIEIQKKVNPKLNSYIFIDVVTKENNENIFLLPINRYIFETFNNTNNIIKKR